MNTHAALREQARVIQNGITLIQDLETQLKAVRSAVEHARRDNPHWSGWEPILSALRGVK